MEHPLLFKKGMQGLYFTNIEFAGWLAYALLHAGLIYVVCIMGFGDK
jgi:hypothetical protein